MNGSKPYMMTLNIKGTSGDFKSGALEKQIKGMELAAFTEDGTVNYEMYPCSQDYPQYEGQEAVIWQSRKVFTTPLCRLRNCIRRYSVILISI